MNIQGILIVEKEYTLSVNNYVEQEDTREKVDIVKLNAEIKQIVAREQFLRTEYDCQPCYALEP